ncbi:MAG: ABC transporter substrate-binding protein [Sphaerochaetaceae bacterium]
MKRLLSVFLVSVLILSLVTAQGTSERTSEKDTSQSTVTTLSVWSFVQAHMDAYKKLSVVWNEDHPDEQIKLVDTYYDWASMHDKLYSCLLAGEGAPDLCDVEIGKWPNFMQGEIKFLDLTDYVLPYKDQIVNTRMQVYQKNGKQYGVPSHIGATVMYYNIDLLQKAGIDYRNIKTWDDFANACRIYKAKTGKYMTYIETYGAYEFSYMMAELGHDIITADGRPDLYNADAVRVCKLWKSWYDEGIIGTIPTGNADTDAGKAAVASGEIAALGYPLWYMGRFTDVAPDLAGKIAIAPLPVFKDATYKSVGLGGTGTVVIANGPHADLAARFITWAKLSETGGITLWQDLGYDPINTKVWTNLTVTKDPGNKFLKYFATNPFDVLSEIKDGIFACKTMQNSATINDYLSSTTWNRMYINGEDVEKVLKETQTEMETQAK